MEARYIKSHPDTRVDTLVKTGDNIAAQLTSTGDTETIVKLEEMPPPQRVSTPD